MKKIVLGLIVGIFCFTASAQWQSIGPFAGNVSAMYLKDGVIYAGLRKLPYGIFYSEDTGKTWSKMGELISDVLCMLKTSDRFYSGSSPDGGGRVYYSSDSGKIWEYSKPGSSAYIYDLKEFANAVYCATDQGVFYSLDKAKTWQVSFTGAAFTSLCVQKNALIVTGTTGIMRSLDSGKNWSYTKNASAFSCISIGNTIVASEGSAPNGVFVSTDTGSSWTQFSAGLSGIDKIRQFQAVKDTLYALQFRALFRSVDSGKSWLKVSNDKQYSGFKFVVLENQYFFGVDQASLYGGIFKYNQIAGIWEQIALPVYDAHKVTSNGKSVFLDCGRCDDGKNWIFAVQQGLATRKIKVIDTTIFTLSASTMEYSKDNGINYQRALTASCFDLIRMGNRLIATSGSQVFYADNSVTAWNYFPALYGLGYGFALGTTVNGRILLSSRIEDSCSYYSDDTGKTWTVIKDTFFRGAEAIYTMGNTVYARVYQSRNILNLGNCTIKSTDRGITWTKCDSGMAKLQSGREFTHRNSTLYIATDWGVYFMDTADFIWRKLSTSGYHTQFMNIDGVCIKDSFMFASIRYAGVWKLNLNKSKPEILSTPNYSKSTPFKIYPNPTSAEFCLDFGSRAMGSFSVSILDLNGKCRDIIKENSILPASNKYYISTKNLSSGTYFVQVKGANYFYTQKIILIK